MSLVDDFYEGERHLKVDALWHEARNGSLRQADVRPGSHRKVWWRCSQGHSWEAPVYSVLINGYGCPYCSGLRAMPGENDIATLYPELMKQWDAERNDAIDPRTILPSSHDKVWWRCELGHSWQAMPFSRTRERSAGCPYCTGRKVLPGFNDLATLRPDIAKEWYQPLNGDLTPQKVTLGSNKKVWWRCREHHVWQAAIYSRARKAGTGCPVCTGFAKRSTLYEVKRGRRPKQIEISIQREVQQEAAAGGLS